MAQPFTFDEARAFVSEQLSAATGEVKKGWTWVSDNLSELYQKEKAIAMKDGKVDLSDFTDMAKRGGQEGLKALTTLKDKGAALYDEATEKGGALDNNKGSIIGGLLMGALALFALDMGPIGALLMLLLGAGLGGMLIDKEKGAVGGFIKRQLDHTQEPAKEGDSPAKAQDAPSPEVKRESPSAVTDPMKEALNKANDPNYKPQGMGENNPIIYGPPAPEKTQEQAR